MSELKNNGVAVATRDDPWHVVAPVVATSVVEGAVEGWCSRDWVGRFSDRPDSSSALTPWNAQRTPHPLAAFMAKDLLALLQVAKRPDPKEVKEVVAPRKDKRDLGGLFQQLQGLQSVKEPIVFKIHAPVVTSGTLAITKPVDDLSEVHLPRRSSGRVMTNPILWDWSQQPIESKPEPDSPPEPDSLAVAETGPASWMEILPAVLQKILPEALSKALPEAFSRLPTDLRQQLVRHMAPVGVGSDWSKRLSDNKHLTPSEQQQLNRFWADLWEDRVEAMKQVAKKKSITQAQRWQRLAEGHTQPPPSTPMVPKEPEVTPDPAVQPVARPQEPIFVKPVVTLEPLVMPVPSSVAIPVVHPNSLVPPGTVASVAVPVKAPQPVVSVIKKASQETPLPKVQEPIIPMQKKNPVKLAQTQAVGAEVSVPVESVGQGVMHLLADVAGVGQVARRPVMTERERLNLPPTFYDRMGGTVYYGGQSVVAGVAGVIAGSVGLVVGTAGCLLGAVGSLGRSVLAESKV